MENFCFKSIVAVLLVGNVHANDGCNGIYCRKQAMVEQCKGGLTDQDLRQSADKGGKLFMAKILQKLYSQDAVTFKKSVSEVVSPTSAMGNALDELRSFDGSALPELTHGTDGDYQTLVKQILGLYRLHWELKLEELESISKECGSAMLEPTSVECNFSCPLNCRDENKHCCDSCIAREGERCGTSARCQPPFTCVRRQASSNQDDGYVFVMNADPDWEPNSNQTCEVNACTALARKAIVTFAEQMYNDSTESIGTGELDLLLVTISDETGEDGCLIKKKFMTTEEVGDVFDCYSGKQGDIFLAEMLWFLHKEDRFPTEDDTCKQVPAFELMELSRSVG